MVRRQGVVNTSSVVDVPLFFSARARVPAIVQRLRCKEVDVSCFFWKDSGFGKPRCTYHHGSYLSVSCVALSCIDLRSGRFDDKGDLFRDVLCSAGITSGHRQNDAPATRSMPTTLLKKYPTRWKRAASRQSNCYPTTPTQTRKTPFWRGIRCRVFRGVKG